MLARRARVVILRAMEKDDGENDEGDAKAASELNPEWHHSWRCRVIRRFFDGK